MIQELIYTSAPKGLKRGSRGFSTVVCTAGMASNLAERLESMSGYRHAFPLNDPQSSLNPVQYSHVTTRLAGQSLSVLSRVSDAGQDYSGRSNKLAHHLVIERPELLTAGPVRLLQDDSVVTSSWDGKVEERPPRTLSNPDLPKSVTLSNWKAAAGDAGWAGAIAEHLLQERSPYSVIFPAGTDTLALVREICDVIPVARRWDITFSTYFVRLLAGTVCQLRFVLDGTSEATSLRNDARATFLDLTASPGQATGGPLVIQARSESIDGQGIAVSPSVSSAIDATEDVSDWPTVAEQDDGDVAVVPVAGSRVASASPVDRETNLPGLPPPAVSGRAGRAFAEPATDPLSRTAIGFLAVLLCAAVGIGGYYAMPSPVKSSGQSAARDPSAASGTAGHDSGNESESKKQADKPESFPFRGQSPFAEYQPQGQEFLFTLPYPALEKTGKHSLPVVLLESLEGLHLTASESKLRVIPNQETWRLQVDTENGGIPLGVLSFQQRSAKGLEPVFEWNESPPNGPVWRQALFGTQESAGLSGSTLTLTAPHNDGTGATSLDVRFQVTHPYHADGQAQPLDLTNASASQQWPAMTDWKLSCFPEDLNLHFDVERTFPKLFKVTKRGGNSVEWDVEFGGEVVLTVGANEVSDGTKLQWRWSELIDGTQPQDAGWLLSEDPGVDASVDSVQGAQIRSASRKLSLPASSTVLTQLASLNGTPLFEIPNPSSVNAFVPVTMQFRCPPGEVPNLKLSPAIDLLLDGQSEKLVLQPPASNEWPLVWKAGIVDTTATFQKPVVFAEYTVEQVLERPGVCSLKFQWLQQGDINRREWLRWCPLTLELPEEDLTFLQRRATPGRLLKDEWIVAVDTQSAEYSGNDFWKLNPNHSSLNAETVLEVGIGNEPATTFNIAASASSTPEQTLFVSADGKTLQVKRPPVTAANAVDQSAIGFLKFELPMPTQEEPEIIESQMTVSRHVDLKLPPLDGEVVAMLNEAFPRTLRPEYKVLRANDDGSDKDGPKLQRRLRSNLRKMTDRIASSLTPVSQTLSLSEARRALRKKREMVETRRTRYEIKPYLETAENLLKESEQFLQSAAATGQQAAVRQADDWKQIVQNLEEVERRTKRKPYVDAFDAVQSFEDATRRLKCRILVRVTMDSIMMEIIDITTDSTQP